MREMEQSLKASRQTAKQKASHLLLFFATLVAAVFTLYQHQLILLVEERKLTEQPKLSPESIKTATSSISTQRILSSPSNIVPKAVTKSDVPFQPSLPAISCDQLHPSKQAACRFVEGRRQDYHSKNQTQSWLMRGTGYLIRRHEMILEATVHLQQSDSRKESKSKIKSFVKIEDVWSQTRNDCERFTLWVRVNGPEIFASKAAAVVNEAGCHWEVPFDLRKSGKYTVDARAVLWDSGKTENKECEINDIPLNSANLPELPSNITEKYPVRAGFLGSKLYHPASMCCEACSRIPSCQYWATPPINLVDPGEAKNGCELFFEKDAPIEDIPISRWVPNAGQPYSNTTPKTATWLNKVKNIPYKHGPAGRSHTETSYYFGCSWSYMLAADFPCLDGSLDDMIYIGDSAFEYNEKEGQKETPIQKPLCTLHDEKQTANGRWIREPFDHPDCPAKMEMIQQKSKYRLPPFIPDHPICWHRDNMQLIGNEVLEWGHYKYLSRESRWISPVHHETKFMGAYHLDQCDYLEFTNKQLQQCITDRKIGKIEMVGDSIAKFATDTLDFRLQNITMWDETDPDSMTVHFNTLHLAHFTWEENRKLIRFLNSNFKNITTDKNVEHYWMNGYFSSSERELVSGFCNH